MEDKRVKRLVEMYQELPEKKQEQVIDQIRYDNILTAVKEVSKTKTVLFGNLYPEVIERQKHFNKFEGMRTGLKYFDEASMGFRPGELVIIAGPSNYGKTMVALNLATSVVVQEQKRVLIISMEMPAVEIASRIYNMSPDHDPMMENIIIQTELSVNTKHIQAMIERHKPDLVLLDHIQFLANQEQGKEYERITAAVANLKRLAIDNKIPILAISHVAKTRSGNQGQATALDLKGSSSIEQDADVGFMINRLAGGVVGEEIVLTLFKHRTKKSELMHLDCILNFNGVKIANEGSYQIIDPPNPRVQTVNDVKKLWR